MLPSEAAIVHCREHQRDGQYLSQGNSTADRIAKQAALKPLPSQNLFLTKDHPQTPYTPEEGQALLSKMTQKHQGWWYLDNGLVLPQQTILFTLGYLNKLFHSNLQSLINFLTPSPRHVQEKPSQL
jgi:hypothetical protein